MARMTMIPRRIDLHDLPLGLTPKETAFVIEYSKDFDARRAAAAAGYSPDSGYTIRDKPLVQASLDRILQARLDVSHIDAEWVLMELVDNHLIARATGKLTASNTALQTIAKLAKVDAFAAEKVLVAGDEAVMERLQRARQRMNPFAAPPPAEAPAAPDEPVSFL